LQTILRRIVQLCFVLVGICLITFLLLHLAPGDPARIIAGDRANAETLAAIRQSLDLDKPLWQQFVNYCSHLLQGELGQSWRYKRPVAQLITQYLWPSLFLLGYVMVLALPSALALAIISARKSGSIADHLIRFIGVAGMAIPVFWLAIMLSRLFGVGLGWFPVSGYGNHFSEHLHHLFLPALSTAIWVVPVLVQSLRAALLEKAGADFVTAARAQGMGEGKLFWRVILPNALLPTLNLFGVILAFLIGGSIIVETVYVIPGLGQLMINSLLARDYQVVQGLTLVFALSTMFITFFVDMLSLLIDPRARA